MKTFMIGVRERAMRSVAQMKWVGALEGVAGLTGRMEGRFVVSWMVLATLFLLCGLSAAK
jgi:hypothetical protein